jgi:hypothetical protein
VWISCADTFTTLHRRKPSLRLEWWPFAHPKIEHFDQHHRGIADLARQLLTGTLRHCFGFETVPSRKRQMP